MHANSAMEKCWSLLQVQKKKKILKMKILAV